MACVSFEVDFRPKRRSSDCPAYHSLASCSKLVQTLFFAKVKVHAMLSRVSGAAHNKLMKSTTPEVSITLRLSAGDRAPRACR